MFVILPSDNETGTLSQLASDFEKARYYTIASIIEGTLADTKIKQGYASPPQEGGWGAVLLRLKIDVVVALKISPAAEASVKSAGIRVIKGAKGLVGDMIDWIADVGVDEFEAKVAALNRPPPAKQQAKPVPQPAAPSEKVEPLVSKDAQHAPAPQGQPKQEQ